MREKRAKLWATMEGFLDTHRNNMGVLSAEDDASYNNMEKELNDLTNEVKRMERRDAIEAELSKPVGNPITEKPQKSEAEQKSGVVPPMRTRRTLVGTCVASWPFTTCCLRVWMPTADIWFPPNLRSSSWTRFRKRT